MVAAQVQEVVKSTQELKLRQETPDSPEALACVPGLQLADIPRTITPLPTAVTKEGASTVLTHDLFTNDVLYLEAALDMRGVPAELLPLVPLFCRSLTQMGTQKENFIELTERIGRKVRSQAPQLCGHGNAFYSFRDSQSLGLYFRLDALVSSIFPQYCMHSHLDLLLLQTGGVSVSPFVTNKKGEKDPLAYLMIRGKAMAGKSGDMLELMRDILLTARLDDKARFTQMVAETKAGLESGGPKRLLAFLLLYILIFVNI